MIEYKKGDLFAEDVEALVNPVNCAGVMGQGLAAEFKRRWPGNFAFYREAYKAGILERGFVLPYQCNPIADGHPYYIFNLPTKLDWRDKSDLRHIHLGLLSLVQCLHVYCISSVALPALGCGEGGLSWREVRPVMADILSPASEETRIVIFEPHE